MKKKAILFAVAIAFAVMAGKIFAGQSSQVPSKNESVLINYTWYIDEDFTYPTGTITDINVEMNRLRSIYPFNVFAATPSGMLNAYEWGYHPYNATQIIYSDL